MVAPEEAAPGAERSVLGARPDLTMLALVTPSGPAASRLRQNAQSRRMTRRDQ
jgi:hypothetical protein